MNYEILSGDCRDILRALPERSVQCIVTSPPYYGLRSYLPDGHADKAAEIGLEKSPEEYIDELVAVFREARRVLRDDGILWLVIGDAYSSGNSGQRVRDSSGGFRSGLKTRDQAAARANPGRPQIGDKPKDLLMIPARVALALQADGWWLRQDNVWSKGNCMPESVQDRTTRSHEFVFMLTKSANYFYDAKAIEEPAWQQVGVARKSGQGKRDAMRAAGTVNNSNGTSTSTLGTDQGAASRNKRSVWHINAQPFPGSHFAVMPDEIATICILAGSRPGDTILDPFGGAGTTATVAARLGRSAIHIDLNPEYCEMARRRIAAETPPLPGLFAAAD